MQPDTIDSIKIKKPCPANWDAMKGDERSRHCKLCKLNVYDFSEMTRDEIHVVLTKSNGRVCGRVYRRDDGKIITKDCSSVRTSRRRNKIIFATIAALLLTVQGFATLANKTEYFAEFKNTTIYRYNPITVAMGWVANVISTRKPNLPAPRNHPPVMGDICILVPPPAVTQSSQVTLGLVVAPGSFKIDDPIIQDKKM